MFEYLWINISLNLRNHYLHLSLCIATYVAAHSRRCVKTGKLFLRFITTTFAMSVAAQLSEDNTFMF